MTYGTSIDGIVVALILLYVLFEAGLYGLACLWLSRSTPEHGEAVE